MYICLCKGITDKQIKACLKDHGATNLQQVRQCLGVASECGKCAVDARAIIKAHAEQQHDDHHQTSPLFYEANLVMNS